LCVRACSVGPWCRRTGLRQSLVRKSQPRCLLPPAGENASPLRNEGGASPDPCVTVVDCDRPRRRIVSIATEPRRTRSRLCWIDIRSRCTQRTHCSVARRETFARAVTDPAAGWPISGM
jgi:hypothetical protein